MKKIVIVAIATLVPAWAQAATYTYICKARDKSGVVIVNDSENTLKWDGLSYKISIDPDCGRYGWHAVGPGKTLDFCTATQGYADLSQNGVNFQCKMRS